MGQFCEVPDDVVFTVEYSVRSAQLGSGPIDRIVGCALFVRLIHCQHQEVPT
jgi:hypothetical protein